MIDNDLRIRRMRQEAADPRVGLILLDVVLGEGAHPDPAGELAPAIAERQAAWPGVVVVAHRHRGGPAGPRPPGRNSCARPGRVVFRSLTEAVEHANARLGTAAALSSIRRSRWNR